MILNIILNLILIPSYGYLGASVSTVITEWILCAILFGYISMKFFKINSLMLVKITLVNISTILFAFYLFKLNTNYTVNIILYLTTYTALIFFMTIVSKEESEMVLSILRSRKQLVHSAKEL